MSNILAIGDIHMKAGIILPLVDQALQTHKVDTIVLMGDYFDEWGQDNYEETVNFLAHWFKEKRENYQVVCLLGNHDASYLSEQLRAYSNPSPYVSELVADALFRDFKVQLAFTADDWLYCHGGYVDEAKLNESYFQPFTKIEELRHAALQEDQKVGWARGGQADAGGIIWCDFDNELLIKGNAVYPKQIVGHTPQAEIAEYYPHPARPAEHFIGIDTFSLTSQHRAIGDGSLLLIEDGKPSVIKTDYVKVVSQAFSEK